MGQFQLVVTFLAAFLAVCKLYKSGHYIITYLDVRNVLFEGFTTFFFFLAFIGIFPDLEMLRF